MTQDEIWQPETRTSVITQNGGTRQNGTFIAADLVDLEKQDVEQGDVYGTDRPIPTSSIIEIDNPNLVPWDGIDDPANPLNWRKSRKWVAIALGMVLMAFPNTNTNFYQSPRSHSWHHCLRPS